ncbi:MAG: hypothetical protein CBB71_01750 [Rhodopirellula sp. TMED11]|nr:MAG: hypothetical protein CBB71_01750 [Rhodopirellula sp. TMED11]
MKQSSVVPVIEAEWFGDARERVVINSSTGCCSGGVARLHAKGTAVVTKKSGGMTAQVRFLAESKVAVKSRQNRKNFTPKCGENAPIGGDQTALADGRQGAVG